MSMSSIGGMSGMMSSASLAQMREQRFKSLDTDGSGEVNETEFTAGASGSAGMDSDIASALFQAFDTDGSGGLTQDELETGFQKMTSSMRSVLIGTQEVGGNGGSDGPPPPPADDSASSSSGGLDSLLSMLQGADGNDSSDDDSSSSSTDAYSVVKSDLKKLLEDLTKLAQNSGVSTQVTV